MGPIELTTREINLTIALTGFMLCFYGLLQVLLANSIEKEVRLLGLRVYLSLALFDAVSVTSYLLNGHPGQSVHVVLSISKFLEFIVAPVLILNGARIIAFHTGNYSRTDRKNVALHICMALQALLIATNLLWHFIYSIDRGNNYHTGPAYLVAYLLPFAMTCIVFAFRVRGSDRMNRQQIFAFDTSFVLIIVAVMLQNRFVGVFLGVLAAILATSALYILFLDEQRNRYKEQIEENTLMQYTLLSGQLEPHFINNTLLMIRALCEPGSKCYRAISDLSEFVGGSLKALKSLKPIPVEDELFIVERYLGIQNQRFGDSITVLWDIRDEDFELPAFSIQLVVENAIKHGIRKSPDGKGTIEIGTYETDTAHAAVIENDGPGFDPDEIKEGTGLSSIKFRVETICGGRVDIQSAPREKTKVVISIPKQGEEE